MRVTQRWQRSREIHKPLEEVRSWVMVTNLATQKKAEPRDCKGGAEGEPAGGRLIPITEAQKGS